MDKRIPTFDQAETAAKKGEASPLEEFVYEFEPGGPDRQDFRNHLVQVLNYASVFHAGSPNVNWQP